jgi:Tfp pilus assembly protein PilP
MKYLILLFSLLFHHSFLVASNLDEIFKNKTTIEKPFELRDPFRPTAMRSQKAVVEAQKELKRDGVYTNIPPLKELQISDLKIVGVMIGKERRAMVKGDAGSIVILKEGMKIGKENAELKAIHPGGIILVEKLVNVYGETEYLETVIPITQ